MALMGSFYHIQPAFTTGEISRDVANRVDLEKYKSALLRAKNAIIRPYGAVCRRGGSEYIGETKYADKQTILVKFTRSAGQSYLLEFGDKYVRVWENGVYVGVEIVTPYEADILPNLRFAQSADTLFICSGKYPVQTLVRNGHYSWRLATYEFSHAYFEDISQGRAAEGRVWTVPGTYTFTAMESKSYQVELTGAGGASDYSYVGGNGERVVTTVYLSAGSQVTVVVGRGGEKYGSVDRDGGASSFGSESARGGKNASKNARGADAGNGQGGRGGYLHEYYDDENDEENGGGWQYDYIEPESGSVRVTESGTLSITPSAVVGNINVRASKSLFTEVMVGSHIRLQHRLNSESVKLYGSGVSGAVRVGEQWKIITAGKWSGDVYIEYSEDNAVWKEYRRYSAEDNFNATESGTFSEPMYLRLRAVLTKADGMTATLTRLPYTHEGEVVITGLTSDTTVQAKVLKPLGEATATMRFGLDVWDAGKGYPRACTFFQDRLVLAGTDYYPHMIWMSRTGDYPNFGVEKANGQVTDDSAVALSLISREMYNIRHLVPAQDLIVLTDGNEWIVPGDKAITPKSAQVKTQTMRGAANCEPVYIGNRLVYVQARGATVRDLGYTYESDNYNGTDLTLLAKHLVQGQQIVSAAYAQEPNSVLYLVRKDGYMVCLTIIREQDVFGWSHWTTQGRYKWVENVPEYGEDSVYVVVERNGKQFIERFRSQKDTNYAYVDSYVKGGPYLNWGHLAGQEVQVVTGNEYTTERATSSSRTGGNVCGLSYETKLEQPALEMQMSDGTLQARTVKINNVTLRVLNSRGGKIGYTFDVMDKLPYKENKDYSGDILATMPNTDVGFNTRGRICLYSDEPYPFNLLAIIRSFTIGGGHVTTHNG